MKTFICAWIFFCFCSASPAQEMYWTPEAKTVYSLISTLRIDEAISIIKLQSITHPENNIWPYLEDYSEFIKIFVREDIREIPNFIKASTLRLEKVNLVPETNPLSLMAQGQIHLHQCALQLQQGEFISAASEINKAFKLLRKNQKLFPDDVANLRLYAGLKAAFGAVPDQYRWLVSIVTSMHGTIEEGLKELYFILRTSTPDNNIFFEETVLFTAIAEGRLNNKPKQGLQLIITNLGKIPESKVVQYLMVTLLIEQGKNDEAIRVLSEKAGVQSALHVPFLDFMLGECKLFRGDANADIYFKNFLVLHKGKHFIKEAHQKLAWDALLKGDRAGYFNQMQQILIKGSNTTDEDQQAMQEAENHATPHPVLLRSRLYYDGGYYDKALEVLTAALYTTLNQHGHRLEFLYRKGRILQAQKADAEALHYLNLTITTGQYEKYYFACSAALQCGIIHESLGSMELASKYYTMCLEMIPDTYSTSLHQKARIGLNRIEE